MRGGQSMNDYTFKDILSEVDYYKLYTSILRDLNRYFTKAYHNAFLEDVVTGILNTTVTFYDKECIITVTCHSFKFYIFNLTMDSEGKFVLYIENDFGHENQYKEFVYKLNVPNLLIDKEKWEMYKDNNGKIIIKSLRDILTTNDYHRISKRMVKELRGKFKGTPFGNLTSTAIGGILDEGFNTNVDLDKLNIPYDQNRPLVTICKYGIIWKFYYNSDDTYIVIVSIAEEAMPDISVHGNLCVPNIVNNYNEWVVYKESYNHINSLLVSNVIKQLIDDGLFQLIKGNYLLEDILTDLIINKREVHIDMENDYAKIRFRYNTKTCSIEYEIIYRYRASATVSLKCQKGIYLP